jgi:transcriptional regulator with XRE-family HTH domain
MVEKMPIKDKLKELREKAGLTQQQLANQADLSISIISAIEQGASGDPRMSTLKALAKVLQVSLDELMEPDEAPAPKKPRRRKGGAA